MAGEAKTVFKYGCVGCLGFVVLLGLAAAVMLAVARSQVAGEQTTSRTLVRNLPAAGLEPALDSSPEPAPATRVLLDIKDADVVIVAGPAGTPPRLEATFDARYFALEQRTAVDAEDPATWHIWFRRVGGSGQFMHVLHRIVGATKPEIRVELPAEVPLALHGNLQSGFTRASLGGLEITEIEIELADGVLIVDTSGVSEPMERMVVDTRQSHVELIGIGDASPRLLSVEATMGNADIDLRGNWQRDAEIDLEVRMAGGSLRLPRGVDIEGLDVAGGFRADDEVERPTLNFVVQQSMGELRIVR